VSARSSAWRFRSSLPHNERLPLPKTLKGTILVSQRSGMRGMSGVTVNEAPVSAHDVPTLLRDRRGAVAMSAAGDAAVEYGFPNDAACTSKVTLSGPGAGAGLLQPSATASQGLLFFQDPTAVASPNSNTITSGASSSGCPTLSGDVRRPVPHHKREPRRGGMTPGSRERAIADVGDHIRPPSSLGEHQAVLPSAH
jgi:hypothetical protein